MNGYPGQDPPGDFHASGQGWGAQPQQGGGPGVGQSPEQGAVSGGTPGGTPGAYPPATYGQTPHEQPGQMPMSPPQQGSVNDSALLLKDLSGTAIVAFVLSIFFPGVGHMMVGQVLKGIVILLVVIVTCGVGYMVALLIAADVMCVAQARRFRPVGPWEFFPEHVRVLGV